MNTDSRSVEILTPTCQTECFINPWDLFEKSPWKMTGKKESHRQTHSKQSVERSGRVVLLVQADTFGVCRPPFQAFEKWKRDNSGLKSQSSCLARLRKSKNATKCSDPQNLSDLLSTKPNSVNQDNRSQSRHYQLTK